MPGIPPFPPRMLGMRWRWNFWTSLSWSWYFTLYHGMGFINIPISIYQDLFDFFLSTTLTKSEHNRAGKLLTSVANCCILVYMFFYLKRFQRVGHICNHHLRDIHPVDGIATTNINWLSGYQPTISQGKLPDSASQVETQSEAQLQVLVAYIIDGCLRLRLVATTNPLTFGEVPGVLVWSPFLDW